MLADHAAVPAVGDGEAEVLDSSIRVEVMISCRKTAFIIREMSRSFLSASVKGGCVGLQPSRHIEHVVSVWRSVPFRSRGCVIAIVSYRLTWSVLSETLDFLRRLLSTRSFWLFHSSRVRPAAPAPDSKYEKPRKRPPRVESWWKPENSGSSSSRMRCRRPRDGGIPRVSLEVEPRWRSCRWLRKSELT